MHLCTVTLAKFIGPLYVWPRVAHSGGGVVKNSSRMQSAGKFDFGLPCIVRQEKRGWKPFLAEASGSPLGRLYASSGQ